MKNLKYLLCLIPILASCSAEEPFGEVVIDLNAIVSESYDTRSQVVAKAYKAVVPSATDSLIADIWFSTTSGTYQETDSLNVHRTINYIGPSNTNPSPDASGKYLKYPKDGSSVYCVGLYPLGEWSTSDGLTATATIDGEKDLMFASEMSGNKNKPLNVSPQIYNHELTWVKIRVRSESHETGETWGHIRNISITSANQASVNLATADVSFTGSTSFLAFEGDKEMPIMSTEFGSVLVSPAPAQESGVYAGVKYYNVTLTCDNHTRENVQVFLSDNEGEPFTGDTKGKVFVLTLYFKTLKSIEFTASLSSWEDEGRILVLE